MGGGEGTSRKRRSSPSSGEEEGRGRKRRDNKESRGRIRDDREEEEEDDRHKKRKKGKHSDRDRDRGKVAATERYSKDRHSKEEESKRKDKDAASSPMTFKEISKDDYFEKGAAADPLMAGQQCGGSAGSAAAAGAGASPSLSNGSWEGMARNRHFILGFMYGYYKEAVVTLPLEHIPALAPRLLDTGICFGFGDPITNIIANTLRFLSEGGEPAHGEPQPGGVRKQKLKPKASRDTRARDEVLSKIVADNVPSPPEAQSIAERSLEGLVTFLTSYYCYLPTWDALRYLCLSRADLLVAVRLIEVDRCHRHRDKFSIHSQAVKIALKCAALSARLPNIDAFVNDSAAVVSHLTRIMPAQSRRRRLSIQDVARFARLLEKPLELKKLSDHMHLAAMRCHQYDMKVPPALTESLRSILLDRIHVVYLTAISRIPMDDFRSRHHHGLLKAGYCYGPFSPILNVVVSTVWYDTEFPAPEAFNLDMICTRLLIRIESRSLDGLISLFLACTSDFSEHDAMVYLLKSNMELPRAIQMAGQDGYDMASLNAAAFKAAGDASSHPQLEAYLHFVMESLPVVQPAVTELLSTETLSSSKIHHLSTLLSSSRSYPYKSLKPMDELTKDALEMVSRYKEEFFSQQNFVRKKVEAALKHYEKTEEPYELHFICAVNQSVGRKDFTEIKYPYSHINFWASPKYETSLILFFAQVRNDDEDKELDWSFCQPVSILSKNARCCYCEFEGTRILHPPGSYCGGAMDFEKIALRAHDITNAQIISHGKLVTCPVGVLGEDYVYFDPFRDVKFIKAMNRTAASDKLDWGDEMRRIRFNREDEIRKIKCCRRLKSLRQMNAY